MERKRNFFEKLVDNFENIKIAILYIFLILGALWHLLDYFVIFRNTFAGPILILLSIWSFYEIYNYNLNKNSFSIKFSISLIYFLLIILLGLIVEIVGVNTGYIFGHYQYSNILKPQILNTPLAIGFAWFSTLVSSNAILKILTNKYNLKFNIYIKSILIGFLMVVFDIFLEPAAIKLNYWTWDLYIVPFTNYLAWFIFGSIFAFIGFKINYLNQPFPKIIKHFFFSQILYFIIIYIK